MNWRPIEEESDAEMSRDHHPARIAGQEREPGSASEDASVAPTATSRTWSSSTTAVSAGSPSEESSRANRHPKAPRADATGRVLIEAPSGPTDSRSGSGAGVGRMLAGWLVALGIGLAWLATTVDAESEPSATAEEVEDRRMLARPLAPAEPDPSALLRQEIAALQEERTALLAELDAAAILMADHQRLTHEFDRTARRWRTATEQLRFLDESLEAAIIERARLATELAIVHRMLDEARDTD